MKTVPRVGVIQFPGSNCEYETARCIGLCGMEGVVLRWNASSSDLGSCDAFVLPGGFSYQDRVRAGAVAARDSVMQEVARAAEDGKPVLGVCNGAQILVESGLVPGWERGRIEASLAANSTPGRSGYLSAWVFVRPFPGSARSPWLCRADGSPFPLPIAHAEGRFAFGTDCDRERLDKGGTTALFYCDQEGVEAAAYPENPNGSFRALAGIMDESGAILAMMPHPERAFDLWQVPLSTPGPWGENRRALRGSDPASRFTAAGPGRVLFESLAAHFGAGG